MRIWKEIMASRVQGADAENEEKNPRKKRLVARDVSHLMTDKASGESKHDGGERGAASFPIDVTGYPTKAKKRNHTSLGFRTCLIIFQADHCDKASGNYTAKIKAMADDRCFLKYLSRYTINLPCLMSLAPVK